MEHGAYFDLLSRIQVLHFDYLPPILVLPLSAAQLSNRGAWSMEHGAWRLLAAGVFSRCPLIGLLAAGVFSRCPANKQKAWSMEHGAWRLLAAGVFSRCPANKQISK